MEISIVDGVVSDGIYIVGWTAWGVNQHIISYVLTFGEFNTPKFVYRLADPCKAYPSEYGYLILRIPREKLSSGYMVIPDHAAEVWLQ